MWRNRSACRPIIERRRSGEIDKDLEIIVAQFDSSPPQPLVDGRAAEFFTFTGEEPNPAAVPMRQEGHRA